jgi:putative transposase
VSILHNRHPSWSWPGRSTVCDILRRHGLVPKQRHPRHLGHPGKPTTLIAAPNEVWSADFQGQCNTGDGLYGDPLTVADGYRRVLLGCQALSSTRVPGATHTLGRRSPLAAWWGHLGLFPACIAPGKPQQNGRHERLHRPLKAATTHPPARTRRAQPLKFDRFREALDMRTPAACDEPSPRTMPHKPPPLEYPDRFEVRDVSAYGGLRWHHQGVNVSHVGVGAYVGLEEIDDGVWNVYFGPLTVGRLLERHRRSEEAYGRRTRRW